MRKEPPCGEWAETLALRQQDFSLAEQTALKADVRVCSACRTGRAEYHFLDARLRALPLPAIKPLPRLVRPQDEQDE